jgi:hypothetical protein
VCFTTDFPSANFLAARGLKQVIVVDRETDLPQEDLRHILRRWQDAGLAILHKRIDLEGKPKPINIPKPSWYGAMFQRAVAAFGLKRGEAGGFGNWVTSSGG